MSERVTKTETDYLGTYFYFKCVSQQFGDHCKSQPASSASRAFGNTTDVDVHLTFQLVPENRENLLLVSTWGRLMLIIYGWVSFEIGGGHTPLPL